MQSVGAAPRASRVPAPSPIPERPRRRLPHPAPGAGPGHPGRGRACAARRCSRRTSDVHEEGAGDAGSTSSWAIVESASPTRVTLKSGHRPERAHAVWGAGLQASAIADDLGLEFEKGNRVVAGPDLSIEGHPEVFAVGDIAWITDTKTKRVLPQLGSVALQAGGAARGRANIARRTAGRRPSRSSITTRARWRPSAAARPWRSSTAGRTLKGKPGRRLPGAQSTWRRFPPGRIARRRWSSGPGRASPTSDQADHGADRHVAMERRARTNEPAPADVFVVFGITGDLAKVMTFHSLYRLEEAPARLPDRGRRRRRLDRRPAGRAGPRVDRRHGRRADSAVRSPLRGSALVRAGRSRGRGDLRPRGQGDRGFRPPGLLSRDPALPLRQRSRASPAPA